MSNHSRYNFNYDLRFDPREIDITVKQYSLFQILRRLQNNEIYLDNYFQRRSGLWDNVRQSRFIESILIRIPIPAFYFAEIDNGRLQVVDGLQRITTLINFFINKSLRLQKLEFLPEFDGCSLEMLPRELQRRIEDTSITAFTINQDTPDQIKYVIFDRLNTGGLKLSGQEMRHALYFGVATEFLEELATNILFREATNFSIKNRRMVDHEYINRFLAFYLNREHYNGNLELFLNNALEMIGSLSQNAITEIRDDFEKAMHYCYLIFGTNAFRKNGTNSKRSSLNKALFECMSVTLSKISSSQLDKIIENKDLFLSNYNAMLDDAVFNAAISSGTSQKEKVFYRFNAVETLLNSIHD